MTDNPPDNAHQRELYRQIVGGIEIILAGLELQRAEHQATRECLEQLSASCDKVEQSLDRLHDRVTASVGGLRQLFRSDQN